MLRRILGLLGWLGVALVFAAVAIRFLKPEWQQWYTSLAIAGLVCTLFYMLSQWREIGRSFSGRQARLGTIAVTSVLVVLGILVALNYLGNRHHKRWDSTSTKQYTLSEQTRRFAGALDQPVKVRIFTESTDFDRFRDVMREYEYASKQISTEYIDIFRQPAMARQYQVQSQGTIVFEYGGRTERVTSDQEQEITNALIKVVQGRQRKVFFLQGHGEKDPTATDRDGYSAVAGSLRSDNFEVEKLVLAQQGAVPADATVIAIAGPKMDLLPSEIDLLKNYLRKGGKIFFMFDPPERVTGLSLPNLRAFVREWAIEIGDNIVVDANPMGRLIGTDASVPLAANYPAHAITERFNFITAYPLARSIVPASGGVNGRFAQTIVETSANSWAETDIKTLLTTGKMPVREEAKGDKAGPISLAAVVSAPAAEAAAPSTDKSQNAPKPETRIAVFGDSDFASNSALGIQGNRDLFLNTVNWLAQQENLIAIRPREAADRRVTLTADQQRRIFWITVLIIPGLIMLAGIQTWWRRR